MKRIIAGLAACAVIAIPAVASANVVVKKQHGPKPTHSVCVYGLHHKKKACVSKTTGKPLTTAPDPIQVELTTLLNEVAVLQAQANQGVQPTNAVPITSQRKDNCLTLYQGSTNLGTVCDGNDGSSQSAPAAAPITASLVGGPVCPAGGLTFQQGPKNGLGTVCNGVPGLMGPQGLTGPAGKDSGLSATLMNSTDAYKYCGKDEAGIWLMWNGVIGKFPLCEAGASHGGSGYGGGSGGYGS